MTEVQCHARSIEFYGESTVFCQCGAIPKIISINTEFLYTKTFCCSPTPCKRNGNIIICENGTVEYFTEQCEAQGESNINQCPTAKLVSSSAISVKQSGNQFKCYEEAEQNYEFNKVHLSSDKVSDQDFARIFCGSWSSIICNSTYGKSKNTFQQCYNNDFFRGPR